MADDRGIVRGVFFSDLGHLEIVRVGTKEESRIWNELFSR